MAEVVAELPLPSTSKPAPKKRFVGRASGSSNAPRPSSSSSPIVAAAAQPTDPLLLAAIEHLLPVSYHFEIPKTIAQIRKNGATRVALQMPEGLLMFGCAIVDILERFSGAECVIMGDVTYGACCIDDYTARALGCDMMVHYGHSCLVPVDTTTIKTLYVFVEISVDRAHLAASVRLNFPHCIPSTSSSSSAPPSLGPALEIVVEPPSEPETPTSTEPPKPTKLALVGTIQFVAAVQGLKVDLESEAVEASPPRLAIEAGPSSSSENDESLSETPVPLSLPKFDIVVPQVKPLSPGEILGCTAPRLPSDTQALLYVGDGRFHLESIMIANPTVPAFRYDPYTKRLTRELYEHDEMRRLRGEAISQARESLTASGSKHDVWAVVLGTLGRQGNLRVLRSITKNLSATSSVVITASRKSITPYIPLLLSELSPAKLALFTGISTFVQTSCPRLSIDWGYAFPKPLLSPYEASVALGVGSARGYAGMGLPAVMQGTTAEDGDYPMDFYADNSMGDWTPRFGMGLKKAGGEKGRPLPRSKRVPA